MVFSSNAGLYPHYLWLFKDILSELRHQFKFHDHLVRKVESYLDNLNV